MSEELIKRLRTVARDEERAWGDEDEVVILLREAADALSRPATVQVPEGFLSDVMTAAGLVAHGCRDKGLAERLRIDASAMLAAAPSAPVARCEYCDGTGDVHDATGEWRGQCPVCAPSAPAAPAVDADRFSGWQPNMVYGDEPADDRAYVEVLLRSGDTMRGYAGDFYWNHSMADDDIMKWRELTPAIANQEAQDGR